MFILVILSIIIISWYIGYRKTKSQTRTLKFHVIVDTESKGHILEKSDKLNGGNMQHIYPLATEESIIQVANQPARIPVDYGLQPKVPYWAHSYVYSYDELRYATSIQRQFYQNYKAHFLRGQFIDLEGNTNYAFILLFDLLNEFDSHQNVDLLEAQLNSLGKQYPKTQSYAVDLLIKKMKAVGDMDGVARLREDHYDYSLNIPYSTFEWRNKYKKTLGLKKGEIDLLDKIWFSSNSFINLEQCCAAVIKLYLKAIAEFEAKLKEENTSITQQFSAVADIVARKHFRYRKDSSNYKYAITTTITDFYTNIFKCCENAAREAFAHKRKILIDPYATTPEAKEIFDSAIINPVNEILKSTGLDIVLDEQTEICLNKLNTTRWKAVYDDICSKYSSDQQEFLDKILELGRMNIENPSIENIFFESSKFISKHNQVIALQLYIHYLHHDMMSATFDNKQLTKSVQKSLFRSEEQLVNFQLIVDTFIQDKDLKKALDSVVSVYAVKRKKIQLNPSSIKSVQQQHSGTVELLNTYLEDSDETVEIITNYKPTLDTIQSDIALLKTVVTSRYLPEFAFSQIHNTTLDFFSKSNFSIIQTEFESFAKRNNSFSNQLIDSINEKCFDVLDDVLIEEDEEYYTINQQYYQKILA